MMEEEEQRLKIMMKVGDIITRSRDNSHPTGRCALYRSLQRPGNVLCTVPPIILVVESYRPRNTVNVPGKVC